eukprot:6322164-Pyramimonas_sp.AAC.1
MKPSTSNFHCEESNWIGWAWARISGQRVRSGSLAAKNRLPMVPKGLRRGRRGRANLPCAVQDPREPASPTHLGPGPTK